jgi:hypothetical protein
VGHHHAKFGPQVYAGVVAYGLLGVFGLAYARRFAPDDPAKDERTHDVQGDWLLSIAVLVGALALVSLLLVQVFSFDIVGAIGHLIQPVVGAVVAGAAFVASKVIAFVEYLLRLLGVHPVTPKAPKQPPHPAPAPQPTPTTSRRLRANHISPLMALILKVVALLAVGCAALLAMTMGFRALGARRPARIAGERRSRSWSWRKMSSWLFRRTKEGVGELLQAHAPHLPHRRRVRSVRDVYRALLVFASTHGRPRDRGETALEFTADLSIRWESVDAALDHLNQLYADERYGLRVSSADLVKQAQKDLKAIEMGSGAPADT